MRESERGRPARTAPASRPGVGARRAAAIGLLLVGVLAPAAAAAAPSAAAPAPASTAELEARLAEQAARIAAQEAELAAQRERIERLETALRALEREVPALQVAEAEAARALEERLASLEKEVQELPELEPASQEFPGSIPIPGTAAALRVGGRVQASSVFNTSPLEVEDRFVTAAIPVGADPDAGEGSRSHFSAAASRFNIDFREPTAHGPLRAFLEADFAGDANTLRLRHAFARWHGFVVGQTWSTFSDPEAEPDGIDREGLNAISLFRHVQLRWEGGGERALFAAAAEDPRCSVTGAECVSRFPDVVARVRWNQVRFERRAGHVQLAALLRRVIAERQDVAGTIDGGLGGGLALSGSYRATLLGEGDRVKFAAYLGRGIGSYVTDLDEEGGQDGVYDPATGELELLDVAAGYVGYERPWNERWSSTLTLGLVRVDNLDSQPGEAYHATWRASLNLIWSPLPRLDVVGELLAGERENRDGRQGDATQLQIGSRWRF